MKLNARKMADKLARRKRRVEKRLQSAREGRFSRMISGAPAVLSTTGLKYELADKTAGHCLWRRAVDAAGGPRERADRRD